MISQNDRVQTTALDGRAVHQSIRSRTVHPTGTFVAIEPHEIDQSVPARFAEQVRKFPDRIALKSKYHQLTYAELDKLTNRIANAILNLRGEGSEPVALLFDHDILLVAAMYSVLKAGKFFVVLDRAQPQTRLETVIDDAQTHLILADAQNLERARALAGKSISVLAVDQLDDCARDDSPNLNIPPEAYAYLVYTSGSSGVPKGVIENHLDVLHFVRVRVNNMHICPDDRILQMQPFSFSGAMSATFSSLLSGAGMYVFDPKREGIAEVVDWLLQEKITIFISVPPTYRQIVASLPDAIEFPDVRIVWLGGDRTFAADIEAYRRIFSPHCTFRNGYGASEIKVITEQLYDHSRPIPEDSIPVGYTVIDTDVLIMDDDGNEVTPGEIGEIVVRSRYVCPGYWRRPELTAAKFGVDPSNPDKRLYWTGDLGRMDADGCLHHLGRKDFQIKVRGQRVEITEIESTILRVPGVKEAVVALRQFGDDERLVAYIEGTADCPNNSRLRRILEETLPAYMIPGHFVRLPKLPQNVNGKIDRLTLPMPDHGRPWLDTEYIEPSTKLESTIVEVWSRLLQIEQIGVTDDFFDLGGHSLLAIQMLALLEKSLGQKIPVAALVQGRTVRGMASWISGQVAANIPRMLVPIQTGGTRTPMYLVPPLAASAVSFVELARALGPDQPLYALDDAVLPGDEWTMANLAAFYLSELRSVQPAGPYVLGGRCFGAKIALEMTCQLEEAGDEVKLLVIIEGDAPRGDRPADARSRAARYTGKLQAHWQDGTIGTLLAAHARWRLKRLKNRFTRRIPTRSISGWIPRVVRAPMMIYQSQEFFQLRYHEVWHQWAEGKVDFHVIDNTSHDSFWEAKHSIAQIAKHLSQRVQQLDRI